VDEADQWTQYDSKSHGFVIHFPNKPTTANDSPSIGSNIGKTELSLEAKSTQPGISYQLQVYSIPSLKNVARVGRMGRDIISELMRTSSDVAITPIKGKKIADCEIMMFGNPGRAFTAIGVHEGLPAVTSSRSFLKDGNLYFLQVVQAGPATVSLQNAMRFFGSFKNTVTPSDGPPFKLGAWSASLGSDQFNINHHYQIKYSLESKSTRKIKLIDAGLHFRDLLGNELFLIRLLQDVQLPAMGTIQQSGQWRMNQFTPGQDRLAKIPAKDVVTALVIRRVVFDDNTILDLTK
jgi:hypothetical protein